MSTQHKTFKVIRPDARIGEGAPRAISHLLREIWSFRHHIRIVFREQFRASYYGAGFGVFWNYALPLVPLSVYLLMSKVRVFPNFEGINSLVYITLGVTLWFLFAGCLQVPIQVVKSRNSESMKTAFPLSAVVVSGFTQTLFDTFIRLFFVCVVVVCTKSWPHPQVLLLPLIVIPGVLLFLGAGLFFGILNVIYKDVSSVVNIGLQYGIFISGVIFPLSNTGLLAKINAFNPFFVFIESCRSLVFHGVIVNINSYLAMAVFSIAVFILSCRVFYVMEYRIRGIN